MEHAVYGTQFKVERYQMTAPEDKVAVERYLGSGAVKGVGAALAARIVKRLAMIHFALLRRSRIGLQK